MIATIVCGAFIVLAVFIGFLEAREDGYIDCPLLITGAVFIAIIIISLSWGYKQKPDNERRTDALILYENCPCGKHLDGIYSYNISVDEGNNLWCRFKKEDRSEYLIDIDELLKGDENDTGTDA